MAHDKQIRAYRRRPDEKDASTFGSVRRIAAMLASVFLPAMASEQQSQPANSVVSATGWHGPLVARVQVWSLRIRSCPSISCRQVGSLRYGTRVHIFNKAGGWSSIAPGMWVASYLLRS
jgi:hypothetical protein